MSLEQAAFVSQIVSAVAVIASLIFVGFQLRQNTKSIKAATSQSHSAQYQQVISCIVMDGEVARLWRVGLNGLDGCNDDERVRFFGLVSILFRFYESSRTQWRHGQLDKEHWHTIEQQAISLRGQPGIETWWSSRRYWHSEDFRNWFENLKPAPVDALYNVVAR